MKKRLTHDASWAQAERLFREVLPLIPEQDARKWWALIYETISEAVASAFEAHAREMERLNPRKAE
jgi:hypothetical protein